MSTILNMHKIHLKVVSPLLGNASYLAFRH